MGQVNPTLPTAGSTLNSIADAEVVTAFTQILGVINGSIDSTNIAAALAQAATVNQAGQVVKGAVNIATSESRTNTAYGTLTTPDQVTGLVLPANGLIAVWYQATWQESVSGAARASIFIGANQLVVPRATVTGGATEAACMTASGATGNNAPLASCPVGLVSKNDTGGGSSSDATTGQAQGMFPDQATATNVEIGGTLRAMPVDVPFGGPCYIDNLAAGTYTVSVQFKASSGSVTASNRRLRALVLSFS